MKEVPENGQVEATVPEQRGQDRLVSRQITSNDFKLACKAAVLADGSNEKHEKPIPQPPKPIDKSANVGGYAEAHRKRMTVNNQRNIAPRN